MHVHKVSAPQEMHTYYSVTEETHTDTQNKRICDEEQNISL